MRRLCIFLCLCIFPLPVFACMPHSPSIVIIWDYRWTKSDYLPYRFYGEERKVQFVKVSNEEKPFAKEYTKLWKKYFIEEDFDSSKYKKGDTIIMLADYINGSDIILESYFNIFEIAKLSCNNNSLSIEYPQWNSKQWWKNLWQCGNYKPEWVMDEKELLSNLNELYNFCENNETQSMYKKWENTDIHSIAFFFGGIFLFLCFWVLWRYIHKK